MRWILVFLFLYLIPLVILFKNYNNLRRSFIYSSMYVVAVSTIVISNIYISGLNKIKEVMYYQNYASDRSYSDKYASNFDENFKVEEVQSEENQNTMLEEVIAENKDIKDNIVEIKNDNKEERQVTKYEEQKGDKELVSSFKKDIYDIEVIALMPMRECIPYTKNITKSIKNLSNIKEDVEYASLMCQEVIEIYETMNIPQLSNSEYTKVIQNSKEDVQTAYELRKKAMDSALKLIETKNPKYIGSITEYLNLSDEYIDSFKERIKNLNEKIDKQETLYN